jgi:hypothetical protein
MADPVICGCSSLGMVGPGFFCLALCDGQDQVIKLSIGSYGCGNNAKTRKEKKKMNDEGTES